jgi:hypothetical protein
MTIKFIPDEDPSTEEVDATVAIAARLNQVLRTEFTGRQPHKLQGALMFAAHHVAAHTLHDADARAKVLAWFSEAVDTFVAENQRGTN